MTDRGIAFYDQTDSHGREIIVAFGGFQFPDEFFDVCDNYKVSMRRLAERHFLSTYTQGPRIDEMNVVYSRAPDGRVRVESDAFRKTLGPEGRKDHNIEVLYMAFPETVDRWLSDKPLYMEGMGTRFAETVTRRHGGLPIGVCTAWNEDTGLYMVQILQELKIITPEEIIRARERKGFMRDKSLEELMPDELTQVA